MKQQDVQMSHDKMPRPVGEVPKKSIKGSVEFLNQLLADEYTLFTKTLNYHWNVEGPRFHSLHEFLEEQYHSLLKTMDEVAERVRVLGDRPLSTVKEFNDAHTITEKQGARPDSDEMIQDLLQSHMMVQEEIKDFLSDEKSLKRDFGTEDFLVALLQSHEKTSWMLRSHLTRH